MRPQARLAHAAVVSASLVTTLLALVPAFFLAGCGGNPAGPDTGTLAIAVSGLPNGAAPTIALSGPDGFSQSLTGAATLGELSTGEYTLTASPVTVAGSGYAPSPGSQTVSIPKSDTAQVTFQYALSTGALQIVVSGLPNGSAAAVVVTGPGGFSQTVNASTTLTGLAPGDYTIAASPVTAASGTYDASPATQTVTVPAGITPASASVTYSAEPGSLTIAVAGLPGGVAASIVVTAPDFSRTVTESTTLQDIPAGSYTVTAAAVQGGGKSFSPAQATQVVAVPAGGSGEATVTYAEVSQTTLNLRIDGLYIVQSTQDYAGDVPLVAGRDGLLRVFVVANRSNSAAAKVRARLYEGDLLIGTFNLSAPASSTPTSARQALLTSSWNTVIPGSLIRPNLEIEAEVDPDSSIAESNEGDNLFPLAGGRTALDVRTVPVFSVSLIPIRQSNGAVGGVGSSNKGQFTSLAQRMHPLLDIDAVVHAAFDVDTTIGPEDGDAWTQILSEIEMLRVSEATGRYYYGVVNADYCSTGGLAGIGYVGLPSAVGWDCLAGGSAGAVSAHEWGHNWGRQHSPCGNVADPDPSYPYADGKVGVFGYDVEAGVVEDTSFTDIMGYCSPQWISDFTYRGVMAYRAAFADRAGPVAATAQPCIVVWGRIVGGRAVLEPAFEVVTRPSLPRRAGSHSIEGRAADGSRLFDVRFDPAEIADLPGGQRAFAFAIPLASSAAARLATVRLDGPVSSAVIAPSAAARRGAAPPPEARRTDGDRVTVRYDAGSAVAALVRDGDTGEILAVARGGAATVSTRAGHVEVVLSNGVRSETHRLSITQ